MAFWNDAASEPKRQHRFLVYMDLGQNGFVPYLAKSVTKPSFEVSETEHKFLGNTYYYPGSLTWNEITCTIINSIDPDGQDLLLAALEKSGYLFPNVQGEAISSFPGTINKEDSLSALGEVVLAELDGEGREVGVWTLKNAFIKSATFGDLDYAGDELLNIEIGMRYDWAAYESKKGGGGVYGGA
jgi:hypothetical protein